MLRISFARLLLVAAISPVVAPASGQQPLCSQLPASERERARTAGLCRDPAKIIDVAPRGQADTRAPTGLPVPNVVGSNFDDARNRLSRFTVQRSYRAAAEPGGTVLAQSPMAPATLSPGAAVSLMLSDGSLVRVPRVTGVNINEARQRLQKDADLRPQPIVVTSDMRVGTVIEQQPAEGTLVKRNSVIRLQVSAGQEGPEMTDVPNVVGMPFDRAKSRLARFSVERVERVAGAPEGRVVEQTPRAQTQAAVGSVIALTVSAPARAMIEVFEMPDVVGRSYTDVQRSLIEFSIDRTEVDNAAPRGQIVAQTPMAGSSLTPGDAVVLQISAGPESTVAATLEEGVPSGNQNGASGRAVLAIGASVLLGLIIGALMMRQWLVRRATTVNVDDVTPMEPGEPRGITSVDILLDEEAAAPQPPLEDHLSAEQQEKVLENDNAQQESARPGP